MARLRFPGRPGHRFERISVRYFADDYRNIADPSLAFLPRFQSGLKEFRELTGASDEENEFEGFTKADVKESEGKLREIVEKEKKAMQAIEASPTSGEETPVLVTRLRKARNSLDSLPASERTRNRIKTLVRKSYSDVVKTGLVSPGKTHAVVKLRVLPGDSKTSVRDKPKKFKLDYKAEVQKAVKHAEKATSKMTEKDRAKFLLEKARQANLIMQQKAIKRKLSPGIKYPKKQFVLPTQSSRSSRVIKPNKRFLEDESFSSDVKKSKLGMSPSDSFTLQDTSVTTSPTPVYETSPSKAVVFASNFFSDKSPGLLEQPLICAGKRDRKPSLKIRLESSEFESIDSYSKFEQHFHSGKSPPTKPGGLTSPLAAPKLGTSLFTSPESQAQFQKATENQRLGMLGLGSARKQGASIVQKAKLQLNRAALNKSKAALARSLKAEMTREAKLAELAIKQELTSPLMSPVTSPVSEDPAKKRKRKCCIVCSQKTDLQTYNKFLVCVPCKSFYMKVRWKFNAGKLAELRCKLQTGKCKITPEKKSKCSYCRLKVFIEAGFPRSHELQHLIEAIDVEEEAAAAIEDLKSPVRAVAGSRPVPAVRTTPKTVKVVQTARMAQAAAALSPRQQEAKTPAVNIVSMPVVKMVSQECNTDLSPTQYGLEQEFSPLRAGEGSEKKHKKRRAFKELLRTKQEKPEPGGAEVATPAPPTTISPVQGSVEESPSPGAPGPRIKHVCRNAAVVLGKPLARFQEQSQGLRLSALPTLDKVKLWKKDEENKAATEESDDEMTMDQIIQKSPESVVIVKKSPAVKSRPPKKLTGVAGLHLYKRKMRCKKCPGCLAKECGTCRNCLDNPKYGGPGTLKQACIKRRCTNPLIRRRATAGFINPKDSGTDSNTESVNSSPEKRRKPVSLVQRVSSLVPGAENSSSAMTGLGDQSGTLVDDQTQAGSGLREDGTEIVSRAGAAVKQGARTGARSEVRALDFDSMPEVRLERVKGKSSGKISSKLMKKFDVHQKFNKTQGNNDAQCYPVSLQNVIPASRQWGGLLSQPKYHPIKVDFKADCDINSVWTYGFALTMSAAMSVRTLCFLCGSAGKHEMIYCNLCCEPFHEFCLEDYEKPSPEHYDDWVCPKCQYCHVCGMQNHLLQCDRCQNTYHPGCLGPNYPTKPSKKKNIWICTKCVKCKSCGATTPGASSDATWTYDFSLCHECGQLMDKGNFCPICHKCYSDDDWESKMIQCNTCESWVHSRCEGLTDEMYEILSYLPEDLSFYCRNCHPQGCPEWERTLKRELQQGLENILQTLILTKSAQYILKQDQKRSPIASSHRKAILGSPVSPAKSASPQTEETICHEQSKTDGDKSGSSDKRTSAESETVSVTTPDKTVCDNVHKESEETLKADDSNSKLTDRTVVESESMKQESSSQRQDGEGDKVLERCTENTSEATRDQVGGCDLTSSEQACDTAGTSVPMDVSEVNNTEDENVCDNSTKVCDSIMTPKPATDEEHCTTQETVKSCDPETSCEQETDKMETSDDHDEKATSVPIHGYNSVEVINPPDMRAVDAERVSRNTQKQEIPVSITVIDPKKMSESPVNTSPVKAKLVPAQALKADVPISIKPVTTVEGVEKSETESVVEGNPSKKALSVHFKIDDGYRTRERTPEQTLQEEETPTDLMTMAEEMKTGRYKSVAVFCEDILRIIQCYLDDDAEIRTSRKKAIISARSCFVKQMEKIFPWFRVNTCRYWYSNKNMPHGMLPDATLPPSGDHTYAQWLTRAVTPLTPQPSPFKKRAATPMKKILHIDDDEGDMQTFLEGEDMRKCMFCKKYGDQDPDDAGRLLYCGQDDWCHVNCALWSAEVYEDANGSLQNMVEAFSRGKQLKCDGCQLAGATVGCNTRGCKANYHFMCARQARCRLQEDKKVFCLEHTGHVDGEIISRNRFKVIRRVVIDTLSVRTVKKSWSKGLAAENIRILFGSCCVESLGRLTDLSDKPKCLQPVDFVSTRIYWSTKDARRRCVYTCRVIEVRPAQMKSPTVAIRDMRIVHDENHPDYVPLSTLDLSSFGIGSPAVCGKSGEDVVDLTVAMYDSSATLSATEDCQMISPEALSTGKQQDLGVLSECQEGEKGLENRKSRSASFSGISLQDHKDKLQSDSLSSSWPRPTEKTVDPRVQPDLSFLSPQTLKMLNIKDPSKYTSLSRWGSENVEDDDCKLLKIADRLNRAAAKCSKTDTKQRVLGCSPVERRSPVCLSRSASPVARQERSQSVDTVDKLRCWSVPRPESPFGPSLSNKLSQRPFSPPIRMQSRARSLSVDKEVRLSNSISVKERAASEASASYMPNISGYTVRKPMKKHSVAISNSLMSPEPTPVDCSSPVINYHGCDSMQDITKISESEVSNDVEPTETAPEDNGGEVEAGVDTDLACVTSQEDNKVITDIDNETSSVNLCLTDETGEAQETIVVMTESGESLSEEEAIKIVQEVLESRSSSESMTQVSETIEEENSNLEACRGSEVGMETENEDQNNANQDIGLDNDTDCLLMNEEEDRSDSPFVPQIDRESLTSSRGSEMTRNIRLNRSIKIKATDDKTEEEEEDNDAIKFEYVDKNDAGQVDEHTDRSVVEKELAENTKDLNAEIQSVNTQETDAIDLTEPDNKEDDTTEPSLSESRPDGKQLEEDKDKIEDFDSNIEDDSDLELLYEITDSHESESEQDKENSEQNTHVKESTCSILEASESENMGDSVHKDLNSIDKDSSQGVEDPAICNMQPAEIDTEIGENLNSTVDNSEKFSESNTQTDDRSDAQTNNKSDAQTSDRSDSDEIDGDEIQQVLNPSEMKAELTQIFSESGLNGDSVERDVLLNCIAIVEEEEDGNARAVKYLGLNLDKNSPETVDESVNQLVEALEQTENAGDTTCETDTQDDFTANPKSDTESTQNLSDDEAIGSAVEDSVNILKADVIQNTDEELVKEKVEDERNSTEKHEVLRGLGLGTCDEVEKIKNSPTKTPSPIKIYEPKLAHRLERKRRFLQRSPLKIYPLRKSIVYPVRKDDTATFLSRAGNIEKLRMLTGGSGDNPGAVSMLPVLDPISKKIKEESIAKSCPGDKGPFKCPMCRRSYRTETSYKAHIKNCTFCVSSSEEEEINESDGELSVRLSKTRKQVKLMRHRGRLLKLQRIGNTENEKAHCNGSKSVDKDENSSHRSSLRGTTINQRVALEVEEKRLQTEAMQGAKAKRRGRTPLKRSMDVEKDAQNATNITPALKHKNPEHGKRGRGRPRKDSLTSPETLKLSDREMRRKSRELRLTEMKTESSESDSDSEKANPVGRGRGRPRKRPSTDTDSAKGERSQSLENIELGKRKSEGGTPHTDKDRKKLCNGLDNIGGGSHHGTGETDFKSPNSDSKSGRGRPRKLCRRISNESNTEDNIENTEKEVIEEGKSRTEKKDAKSNTEMEVSETKAKNSKELMVNGRDDSDVDNTMDKSFEETESSDESAGEILDPLTGLLIDKATGKLITVTETGPTKDCLSEQRHHNKTDKLKVEHVHNYENVRNKGGLNDVQVDIQKDNPGHSSKSIGMNKVNSVSLSSPVGIQKDNPGHSSITGLVQKDNPGHSNSQSFGQNDNPGHSSNKELMQKDNPGHSSNKEVMQKDNPGHSSNQLGLQKDNPGHSSNKEVMQKDNPGHSSNQLGLQKDNPGHSSNKEVMQKDNPGHSSHQLGLQEVNQSYLDKDNLKHSSLTNSHQKYFEKNIKGNLCVSRSQVIGKDSDLHKPTSNSASSRGHSHKGNPNHNPHNSKLVTNESTPSLHNLLTKTSSCEERKKEDPKTDSQVKSPTNNAAVGVGLPSTDIPKAVLQLLKDGHKVIIKNPKLNKSFLWQKTENGYVGRSLDTTEFETLQSPTGKSDVSVKMANTGDTSGSTVNSTKEKGTELVKSIKPSQSVSQMIAAKLKGKLVSEQRPAHGNIPTILGGQAGSSGRMSASATSSAAVNQAPTGMIPLRAEYMGGVVIAKKKDRTIAQVRERIEKSESVASNYLKTLAFTSKSLQGRAREAQPVSVSSITNVLPNSLSNVSSTVAPLQLAARNIQPQISPGGQGFVSDNNVNLSQPILQLVNKTPMLLQSSVQQQSSQRGPFPQFAQTGLHTLTGAQAMLGLNVSNLPSETPLFQQPMVSAPISHQTPLFQQQTVSLSLQSPLFQHTSISSSPSFSPVFQPQMFSPPNAAFLQSPPVSTVVCLNSLLQQQLASLQSQQSVQKPQLVSSLDPNTQLLRQHLSSPAQPEQSQQTVLRQQLVAQTQLLQQQHLGSLIQQQLASTSQSSAVTALRQHLMSSSSSAVTSSFIPQVVKVPNDARSAGLVSSPQVPSPAIQSLTSTIKPHSVPIFNSQLPPATSSAPFMPPSSRPVAVQPKPSTQAILTASASTSMPSQPLGQVTQQSPALQSPNLSLPEFHKISHSASSQTGAFSTSQSQPIQNPLPDQRSAKYEKMKKFLMQRSMLPNKPVTILKKEPMVLTMDRDANGIVKGKVGNVCHKRTYRVQAEKNDGRRKQKFKKLKSELQKSNHPHVALPHSVDRASHPLIHPQKESASLPTAAVELEVKDVPLSDMVEAENDVAAGNQNLGHLAYEIIGEDGFTCRADTPDGAWKQLTEKVQDARAASRLKQLSYSGLPALHMLGFLQPSVRYQTEQLYGANYCRKYKFKYHKHELAEQELELVNPSGCIRTEPYSGRSPWDMFSFLLSRYRQIPPRQDSRADEEMVQKSSRRATSMDLPMAMRFRKLKEHSKEAVGVYRSYIHGRGLFCKRKIDAGEMIIEYSGELIRNSMTDIREKYYEGRGIGCYMFRIDDVDVVDATMKGSAARFINHSCEPNCFSKVISVDNRKHIVIFAIKPITRGEELTYDYKFPIEEVKIPCTCGSKKCRKYLN